VGAAIGTTRLRFAELARPYPFEIAEGVAIIS
jgi:hypothetical protein